MRHGTYKIPYVRALVRARVTSAGVAQSDDLVALRLSFQNP